MKQKLTQPMVVENIEVHDDKNLKEPMFTGKCGDYVAVRPCGEKNKEYKTYLGVLLGELASHHSVHYVPKTKTMVVQNTMYTPMIYLPELKEIVYGSGCWWTLIEKEEDLKEITDKTIENVWYVRALREMYENE
jgi:hypothetical protein